MSKKKQSLVVLENINCLEFPTWLVDEQDDRKELAIKKPDGEFSMACGKGLPKQFDRKVLSCLLASIVKDGKIVTNEIVTTRYGIAAMISKKRIKNTRIIDRVFEALEKYKHTIYNFRGVFYCDKQRTTRIFSYLDDVVFNEETKQVYIKFNQQFLTIVKESGYIKYINLEMYNSFKRPVSQRLYELLCKSLEYQTTWKIGLQNLAEKITLQKRPGLEAYYPSDVITKIEPGILEINQQTRLGMNIEFSYDKQTQICSFKKVNKKIKSVEKKAIALQPATRIVEKIKGPDNKEQIALYVQIFKLLPVEEQTRILDGIQRDPFLGYIPNEEFRIFAYMSSKNKLASTKSE